MMNRRKEKTVNFCPVPNCGGVMEEKTIRENQEEKKVWICENCGLVYRGAKPMEIWTEVAKQSHIK